MTNIRIAEIVETYIEMISAKIPEDTRLTMVDLFNWFGTMRDENELNEEQQRKAMEIFCRRIGEIGLAPETDPLEEPSLNVPPYPGVSSGRDPQLLLTLLHTMAADDYGRMNMVKHLSMSPEEMRAVHHMEMLMDAGHVEWHDRQLPRITSSGYDFIDAADKNPKSMAAFLEAIRAGVPYANSVLAALKLLT